MQDLENIFCWKEYAALVNGKMIRNKFFRVDDHKARQNWKIEYGNRDLFESIFSYSQPDRSSSAICPIYFDFDNLNNLEKARADALGLCQMLMDNAKVPQNCIDVSFSGSKGFHILVPSVVFGQQSSPHLLRLYKRMAEKAAAIGLTSIDLNIYDKARIFRMPNSLNTKSGLYKIPLAYDELLKMSVEQIRKIAVKPLSDDSYATPVFSKAALEWLKSAIAVINREPQIKNASFKIDQKFKQGWRMVPCVKAIEEAAIPDGLRHQVYLNLAQYYSFLNMHPDEMLERINKIDSRNPINDPESIVRLIEWACKHPCFRGCQEKAFKLYCKKEICFLQNFKNKS